MSVLMMLSFGGILFAAVLGLARVLRAGSLADRVLGLDFYVIVIATGLVLGSVARDTGLYLPIVIVVALLAFVTTVTVARYIERRGA